MSDAKEYVPDCRVSLSGAKLEGEKEAALTSVEVDLDVDLFGQCTLSFNDPKLQLMAASDFAPGAAVKVEIGFGAALETLFEGEVAVLEPEFRRDLPVSLRVVCYETLHRLALSAMTRAFNNADDGEVLQAVARQHGLSAEGPSGTKEHILQQNTSDATFLRRLAQKQGQHLRLVGKKLVIGDPPAGDELELGPAGGLRKIRVRIKAKGQVSEVAVHGYDPATKREFVGKAKGEGESGKGARSFGDEATLAFAGHEHQPADVATAEKMAAGRMRKLAEGHVTASLDLVGNAALVPGARFKLQKLGARIDGTWRVEQALHRFSRFGYSTRLRAVQVAAAKAPSQSASATAAAAGAGGADGGQSAGSNFLEIVLLDHAGRPASGQKYKVRTADGRTLEGSLDGSGKVRLEGVPPGTNQVTFPGYAPTGAGAA